MWISLFNRLKRNLNKTVFYFKKLILNNKIKKNKIKNKKRWLFKPITQVIKSNIEWWIITIIIITIIILIIIVIIYTIITIIIAITITIIINK
jgi:ABC-type multidrug transport system permease subunit